LTASQFAAFLISPLGMSLLLGLLALLLGGIGRHRAAWGLGCVALCWLWVGSSPFCSEWLQAQALGSYAAASREPVPHAQAIVVLGGPKMRLPAATAREVGIEEGSDRVWHALRLYRAGKAPLIVVSGGGEPDAFGQTEADAVGVVLADLGVPPSDLLLETRSRNTHQNAEFSARLLESRGIRSIVLVTSAMHMQRALHEFKAQGLQVTAAPTDFTPIEHMPSPWRYFPANGSLQRSGQAIKEIAGQWLVCHGPCDSPAGSVTK
jgi:uncharacterized SAM-binding protein YcdF (DUF218 family)